MGSPGLRPMTEADVPGADALRRLAGWNQTCADWRRLLALNPDGSFVAEEEGEIIGAVATITYGRALAWIGMMLVHPDHRRKGLGSQLMRCAIERLRDMGTACIKLDATPLGRPVYEALGFLPEQTLTRWRRPPTDPGALVGGPSKGIHPLTEADWPGVEALDAAAFGTARPRLLRALAASSHRTLTAARNGRIDGFGLLRPGDQADHLGPVACTRPESMAALLPALLEASQNRAVVWDLPDNNASAVELAKRFGFAPARLFTRMYLGNPLSAPKPMALFAIADPSLG
jgi:predicted N-acetyltransferase YhbS